MSSSGDAKTPCPHDHQHNFKQEIEESIRRCEQLLSIEPPVLYHGSCISPHGKGSTTSSISSRRSSRRKGSSGYSRAEQETSSEDFDPEWKKNMGLLINVQDGHVTTVTPLAENEDHPLPTPLDEEGYPPVERVETVYDFSFEESKDSSGRDTTPQSISITTRTVTDSRESNSDITSQSDEWNYDIVTQSHSPSSSASGIASQSSSKSRPRSSASKPASHASSKSKSPGSFPSSKSKSPTSSKTSSESGPATGSDIGRRVTIIDPPNVDVESDHYSDADSGSVTRSERELARAPQNRESGHEELLNHGTEGPFEVTTTRTQEGDYEVITTERCTIFPRHRGSPTPPSSPHLSMKFSSPPTSPSPGTPQTPKSPGHEQERRRVLQDAIAFTFDTPQKFTEEWEWVGECTGIRSDKHGPQGTSAHQEKHNVAKFKSPVRQSIAGPTADVTQKRFKVHARNRLLKKRIGDRGKSSGGMRNDGQDGTGGSSAKTGPTARLHNLSKPRTDLYQKLAHTRAQLEEEHMSECSFKPRVGRRPDPQSQYSAPLISRVTGIEKRVDLRKRARKVIEKEELDQCSFWPQINSNSEYLDLNQYKPIEERALEHQRRREAKIAIARAIEDQEKGLTFRPEINPKSVKIFKQTGLETIDIADRLAGVGSLHSDNKGCAARPLPKNECTFVPEINSNTDIIIRASKMLEGCTPDFFSRQQVWLQRAEKKKKAKEHEIQTEFAFKPNIDSNSDAILKTSPIAAEVFDQPLHKRVDRLYHRDPERRQHIRRKISNEKGHKLRERIKTVVEENFEKAHPFRPKLIAHSPRRPSAEKMEDILHRRRQYRLEKARVLDEMKVIRELQEFEECTFKPQVNKAPPRDQEPVVVKGLGRFLELQDLAKQMKKDQEEWERKIFYQHVYALPKRQYTIPKPFSFSQRVSNSYSSRKREENRSGCTVRFSFQNKVKEQSDFVDFYESSHPTPKNPKWKDVTRWLEPKADPRFADDGVGRDLVFEPFKSQLRYSAK